MLSKDHNPYAGAGVKVTVAMLGARMHYAVPRLLAEAGLLERFFTDSYLGNKPWLKTILECIPPKVRPKLFQKWLGRTDSSIPMGRVYSFDYLGFWFLMALKKAKTHTDMQEVFREVARRFSKRIEQVGFGEARLVYGFNNASLEYFQAAKKAGLQCILEQTILPAPLQFKLLRAEVSKWSGWQPALNIPEFDAKAVERAEKEWGLADCIVAGSTFVRDGLIECGIDRDKVRVVPYGIDINRFNAAMPRIRSTDEPLRVLFVGEVGLRKGVPDLLQALSILGPERVQAKFAGNVVLDERKLIAFSNVAQFLGVVPRTDIAELYQWADIFVLPSIVEGSATVTYEALLNGIPVIATPNAGSIVKHGITGFIVPVGNIHALAQSIEKYVLSPSLLLEHSANAAFYRAEAGLERYKHDLLSVIDEVVGSI